MEIEVRSSVRPAPSRARVRRLLSRAARAAGTRAGEVSILFCGDRRIRTLNRHFRSKDRATDVLAFTGDTAPGGFLGDIVISTPYAARQAHRRGEPVAREIDRLLLHGFLHLMGYDHETDSGEMDVLERKMRRRLGIADRGAA